MHEDENSPMKIYHERQFFQFCALHALNNIFQDPQAFTKRQLDEICTSLSPNTIFNPHKSIFGTGNYDINIIIASLQSKQHTALWWDKRRSLECLCFENIKGFILNLSIPFGWGIFTLPIKGRHWVAVRAVNDLFYNLDSRLKRPELIGDGAAVKKFFATKFKVMECELFLVVSLEVASKESWKADVSPNNSTSGVNM